MFLQALPLSARTMVEASTIFVEPHAATSVSGLGAMGNVTCGRAPHVFCGDLPCHVPKISVWVKLRTTYGAPHGSLLGVLWDDFWFTLCHFLDQFLCFFWTIFCTPSFTTMDLMATTFNPIFWTTFWATICMIFWSFFCSSWNAFSSFLGPKYEACLAGSWTHYLPSHCRALVLPCLVCPVHAAVECCCEPCRSQVAMTCDPYCCAFYCSVVRLGACRGILPRNIYHRNAAPPLARP